MKTAIVAINGDATLCAPGDHPPKVAKKAAHRRCIFSMGVVQSWYRRDTALQCPRRFGVLPRGPCVLLTSEMAKTVRQSPAADDRLSSAYEGLSVVDDEPTPPWTLDGHLRMTLPFAASALRPQTMPASCAFRCAHVHRRASFVPDSVRPSPGARRVCRCARRTARENKSIRDCEN